MLSIRINLSADAQNITGTYITINCYACLQALVNNAFTWQSSCVMANNGTKTAKATVFVRGYNLELHNVIKYT